MVKVRYLALLVAALGAMQIKELDDTQDKELLARAWEEPKANVERLKAVVLANVKELVDNVEEVCAHVDEEKARRETSLNEQEASISSLVELLRLIHPNPEDVVALQDKLTRNFADIKSEKDFHVQLAAFQQLQVMVVQSLENTIPRMLAAQHKTSSDEGKPKNIL